MIGNLTQSKRTRLIDGEERARLAAAIAKINAKAGTVKVFTGADIARKMELTLAGGDGA